MKKKCLVVLGEKEIDILKKISVLEGESMSSIIRKSIKIYDNYTNPDLKIKEIKNQIKLENSAHNTKIKEMEKSIKKFTIYNKYNKKSTKINKKDMNKYAKHIAWLFDRGVKLNDIIKVCNGFSLNYGFDRNELFVLGEKYYKDRNIKQIEE